MEKKKIVIYLFGLFLIFVFSVGVIQQLIGSGYFPMHDDTQVGRVVAMGRALRNWQFPVRWVGDLGYGYGYPLFNFYGPLPYYMGGYLYMLGFSGLTATKIVIGVGLVLAGLGMYGAVAPLIGVSGALVAAVFYMYAPYHAVQSYVRGAVGELWAIAFLPLVVGGIASSAARRGRWSLFIGAVGLAGVILSHTILGYATVVFFVGGLLVYAVGSGVMKRFSPSLFVRMVLMLCVGLGLSAFFWLPAITEMGFTKVSGQIGSSANYRDHFVCLSQLWSSPWGFGGSAAGCSDGLSFMVGKLHILTAVAGCLLLFVVKPKEKTTRIYAGIMILITVFFIFFVTSSSSILWQILPRFAFIQYPWRFLGFIALGTAGIAGVTMTFFKKKFWRLIFTVLLVGGALLVNARRFVPQYLYERPASEFETSEELRWRVSAVSDEYLPQEFRPPQRIEEIVRDVISDSPGMFIEREINTETYSKFFVTVPEDRIIPIHQVFFPGWHYLVNGKEVSPQILGGLPNIHVKAGRSAVELRFSNTPIRIVANMVTVVTVAGTLFFYGKKRKEANG